MDIFDIIKQPYSSKITSVLDENSEYVKDLKSKPIKKNENGETPLHYLVKNEKDLGNGVTLKRDVRMTILISLSFPEYKNEKDNDGKIPLDYIKEIDHTLVRIMLDELLSK